ncbi:MAG: N-acetyl-alpha-D-glucosaminyl L-malate synthase BshA [Acidobacteria bacterium 13_1_40CM_65_14]|jgi:N-acetyl-alpha-D-glucosaminyl L-malate synthase BshA|nr:MAG: N-acetyl-alpha-D-glucosaminyl L-malate synthase BshA [Acidobacteria bacterium 13_1_40CM_65_14]OLC81311.1 MAG: N-acetyl-alpha-D-glucosaminyl L-malate synthase BshA [Acidobacteria bacterium 13_1_40CM_4_65_8]OLD15809.1 MAG: N-acetyl-alpha-D-glucosaminyl L-malate synthase BshA [Acidobacteria bacterium 13_1_40CM_3_65_5]OLE82169.1 MAG: N-acetyl-alpha-D-glucosaminyl L-malate synthase BshA [Acidobacteria bacterium 13_1_20CM_2_65_9]
MNIGMVCYASVGGSGVVATELAHALADRGHRVHVISSEPPFRWRSGVAGLSFERVEVPPYPLFREPQYLLALTNTIARVAEEHRLDIVHAHYAVPHATAAYLADQMLTTSAVSGRTIVSPRTVTTLHGTDITLVGSDPSYRRVVAFSIERSHGVTAVSRSLKAGTIAALGIQHDIRVIPNFLDCAEYRRRFDPALREQLCPVNHCDALVVHVSNFRPVKRVDVALEVFRRIRRRVRARFVLIGDGPERADIERLAAEYEMTSDVRFVGERQDLVAWLSVADMFLLPSAQESFGLAALEAMACEVPVVASNVGGLPEIIEDGVTGFVCPPDAVDLMAERGVAVLTDPALRASITHAAAQVVRSRYCTDLIVPQYEAAYLDVLGSS